MPVQEIATRATAWLALFAWAWVTRRRWQGRAGVPERRIWLAGALVYWVHVAFAYGSFYHWSHAVAWQETAARSLEVTGVAAGYGLLFNYLFGVIWVVDGWVWSRAARAWAWVRDGFMLFMVVNGAVVFVDGPRRYLGVALLLWVGSFFLNTRKKPPVRA